jgi:hypothetical protein
MRDFQDLENAENRVEKWKKRNNLRHVDVPCCGTCKYKKLVYEGYDCSLMIMASDSGDWDINHIYPLEICDRYERKE